MASSLRSLKAQAGAAAAAMFSAGVIAAGALSYDAMSKTLDQGHRDVLKRLRRATVLQHLGPSAIA